MGYKDFFTKKIKWSRVPTKELHLSSGDHEALLDGDADTSTLLSEKTNKDDNDNNNKSTSGLSSGLGCGLSKYLWLLHVALLGANITRWLTWNRWMHPADIFTPVPKSNIQYEWSNFNFSLVMDDPFIKGWTDESNNAWKDFSEGGNMGSVVSTEYLASQGYESIPVADGSGHWVYLEVYHDLHCLSYLRKVIYNSTNGLITDDSDPWMKYHIPHCLNNIRLKLMCHADLGIMTQRWVDGFYEPWLVYNSEHHQCKNWAKIREWAEEHSAANHELPLHPNEDQRTSDALNEPWFDPLNMTYIDGLCGNGYC